MNKRTLLFFDLETTGLDQDRHEIVEAAWMVVSPDGGVVLSEHTFKAAPTHIETADPVALKVNGYNEKDWQGAISQAELAKVFYETSENCVLAGHGITFDERFMRRCLANQGLTPRWHYQNLDTQALAWPLLIKGKIASVSLKTVVAHFNVGAQGAVHHALDDVRLTYKVFQAMMAVWP